MEKIIKLLKEEVSKLRGYAVIIDGEDGEWEPVTTVSMEDIYEILNQLDELEFLSQEWIDKKAIHIRGLGNIIEEETFKNLIVPKQKVLSQEWIDDNSVYASSDGITEEYVHVDDLKELLVPKQDEREQLEIAYKDILERSEFWFDDKRYVVVEKPTIPEFVADFLDGKEGYALYELFDNDFIYDNHDKLARWLYDNDEETNIERELSLVLAHIYDYEVETEQKYYVVNNDNRMMLVRMMDGKTITEADPFKLEDMYEGEKESHRLTEKEIKDYDERYWAFAKPAEEME